MGSGKFLVDGDGLTEATQGPGPLVENCEEKPHLIFESRRGLGVLFDLLQPGERPCGVAFSFQRIDFRAPGWTGGGACLRGDRSKNDQIEEN